MKRKKAQQPQSPRNAGSGGQRSGDDPAARPPEGPASPVTPPLDLTVASLTDLGRSRQVQQDYLSYHIPQDPEQLARWGALYIVADGMGGHQAGDVASQGAVKHVISHYYGSTLADVGTGLVHALRSANRLIYDQAQENPAYTGMGTTMVAAVILGRKVFIANVGDSRAYLIGRKSVRQITEDHSWVGEQLRARLLTAEEARAHPQRNVVTRALGSKPTVEVDLFEGELSDHDILFMCSDGVTGHLQDQEIAALARAHPPEEALRRIVDLANERGGHDNMSILLVGGPKAIAAARPTVASPVQPGPASAAPPARRPMPFALAGVGVAALAVVALTAAILLGLRNGNRQGDTGATSTSAVAMVAATSTLAGPSSTVAVSTATGLPLLPTGTPASTAVTPGSPPHIPRAPGARPAPGARTASSRARADWAPGTRPARAPSA
ncbi:MAG TPA: Stp1/IreP family PP2C-type Ser/Thr phosphatase, partial [Anaerolineae bacterium]|nr:Stp1/IreP family PP2C-type Ser/Thr phosphatase [Anaerolineae bacterium]